MQGNHVVYSLVLQNGIAVMWRGCMLNVLY